MSLHQILASTIQAKHKSHTKIINLKHQLQRGTKTLNYLVDHILYQIFKTILNISRKHGEKTNNPSIRIYVKKKKKIGKRIVFRIKIGNYLELLMPEIMNLLGSTKIKITKNENVPHSEITEVVLFHGNIVKNNCQQDLIFLSYHVRVSE